MSKAKDYTSIEHYAPSRPPMPCYFRYRAPNTLPVWFHHDGGSWGLSKREDIPELIAEHREAYPDFPDPEVVDDDPVEDGDVRDAFTIQQALAYAIATIDALPPERREAGVQSDMKRMLAAMVESDEELGDIIARVRTHLSA